MYKEKRSKHHGVVPIIYPAGAAAFVLHEPCLERTEEQYAYDIAYGISTAEKYHDAVIQYPHHVQGAENAIEDDPDQRYEHCGVIVGYGYIRAAGFYVVSGELLLTPGALIV